MSLTRFETKLQELKEQDWKELLEKELERIHEVDRSATKIWFSFFPLALHKYLDESEDLERDILAFAIKGNYRLADQVDTSHRFLYGHRFWPDVKHAISARASVFDQDEFDLKRESDLLVKSIAAGVKTDESLVRGITLVGLMTLAQAGFDKFSETDGEDAKPSGRMKASPENIIAARSKEEKQGLLGFLKTIDKEFKVCWDEQDKKAKFPVIYGEEIASGAARDQSRDWTAYSERCKEGVIPVECRSAACGTCWVGVIGGAERLSDVERLERKQVKVFGYDQGDEPKPVLRLACQARAEGSVSIVIPPWNGVFGKKIYGVEEVKLEPATTSAVKLRETIADAVGGEK